MRGSVEPGLRVVGVGAVALAVAIIGGLAALAEDEPEGLAICTDDITNQRVADDLCGDFDDTGAVLYYPTGYPAGVHYMIFDSRTYRGDVPAVGKTLPRVGTAGYVRTYSPGLKIGKGVPSVGSPIKEATSTIKRGGFGVKGAVAGSSGG